MSELIITGGTGLLGQELRKQRSDIIAPTRKDFDITEYQQVLDYLVKGKFKFNKAKLIHCAAMTGLPNCKESPSLACKVNVNGAKNLADICHLIGIKMVYISTDYVFDGSQGMYQEDDPPCPEGYYAYTKSVGEAVAMALSARVIRTSFCHKQWPHDGAFADKWSSLDSVDVIADLILRCVDRLESWFQILHVGTERKTFFEQAKKSKPNVKEMSLADVNVSIPRDTSFDLTKMDKVLKEKTDEDRNA